MDRNQFRDMCAAMALQGIILGAGNTRNSEAAAAAAFDMADAMVAERERRMPRDGYGRPLR